MRKAYLLGLAMVALLSMPTLVLAAGGRTLTTTLSGAEEVSSTGVPGVGDPDGSGFASIVLRPGQSEVCFTITVTDIDTPTRAHIHLAPAGANGGITLSLVEPGVTPITFSGGTASGCVTASRELIKDLAKNQESYYVNVHNAEYSAGALRGQLGD